MDGGICRRSVGIGRAMLSDPATSCSGTPEFIALGFDGDCARPTVPEVQIGPSRHVLQTQPLLPSVIASSCFSFRPMLYRHFALMAPWQDHSERGPRGDLGAFYFWALSGNSARDHMRHLLQVYSFPPIRLTFSASGEWLGTKL